MQIYHLEKQIDGIPNYNQGPPGDFYVQTPLYIWVRMHVYKKWNSSIGKSVQSYFLRSDLLYFFFFFFFETGWVSNQTQTLVSISLQSSKFHSRTSDFGAVFENQNPLSSTWRSQFFSGKAQVLRAKSFFKMLVNSQHYCALGTACAVHDNPDFLEFSKNILKFYPDYIVHRHSYTWLVKTVESFPGYPYLNVLTYLEMS